MCSELKNITAGIFFITCILLISCAKVDKNNICPAVECETPTQTIKLNIVDGKSTASLIENSTSDKRATNLIIYSTRLKKEISYNVEIIDTNTSYIVFATSGSDELEIKLGDLTADTLKIETKYVDKDCCGSLQLVKLSVNNSLISIPADNLITIRK